MCVCLCVCVFVCVCVCVCVCVFMCVRRVCKMFLVAGVTDSRWIWSQMGIPVICLRVRYMWSVLGVC